MSSARKSGAASKKQGNAGMPEIPKRGIGILGVLFLVAFGAFQLWRSKRPAASEDALLAAKAPPQAKPQTSNALVPRQSSHPLTYSPNDAASDIANKRLARARHTLEGYKLWARYPPSSRPLSEMPDLQKPHSVQPSTQPLAKSDGKPTSKARVTLSQDRIYLVGDEVAHLRVSCIPAACEVLSATATSATKLDNSAMIGPTPVKFVTDEQGNAVAPLQPANEGFSSYHGGIGIDLKVRVGSEEGFANFQLIYTPAAPARFTGKIREVMEDGSLCLYVEMDVTKAGRYILTGRVNDAEGEGFAYLEFNNLIEAGLREARMCIFGLLVIDQRAKTPFTLRDLEGFLLLEDRDPDRELMSLIEGKVHTTKTYEESAFSNAEWQSEEKTRTIDEFGKDVEKGIDEGGEP